MKTKYFSLMIVLIVLFLGQKNLMAQKNNEFDSKFKANVELADLGNQINTLSEKTNRAVKLIPSSSTPVLKKKAIAAMEQMSFDTRTKPKRYYTLLIKYYGPPPPERHAIPLFVSGNLK